MTSETRWLWTLRGYGTESRKEISYKEEVDEMTEKMGRVRSW